ncbi:MAG: pyrroline-5-carboxylate reductase [Candidatus Schmidhempelia sp.]|nr:pyrroline-5-carboxylate reductase [Candidatus Schmidhempelia sp.]
MEQTIGFIGIGNMGMAMIKGMLVSQIIKAEQIIAYKMMPDKIKQLGKEQVINIATSEIEVAQKSDILFLAVKPNTIVPVLEKIKSSLSTNTVIVSVAAGITLDTMEKILGTNYKIIRTVPNTPALVNAGMTSITRNSQVSDAELNTVMSLFNALGKTEVVPEHLIHAVTGISGSSPAYVFMFIEALADAGVLTGMQRSQAYKFAAQAVLGAAKMVLDTGKHPGELKDMVCSPGGTTIEAVKTLENRALRSAVIEAVTSCVKKSESMSNNSNNK